MNEDIHVLLVDDDGQWVSLTAQLLEAQGDELSVTPATSIADARSALVEDGIDCIVSDYKMPEMDGIELLKEVREERPNVPFILVTGKGDETVASEAISSRVTDYIRKEPGTDQSALLAKRITNAVQKHRTEQALTESEERYRTLVEQSRDAIYIAQDDGFVFVNNRLCELTGFDEATLEGLSTTDVVHPDDEQRVREIETKRLHGSEDVPSTYEARVESASGEVRHCEFATSLISHDGRPAILGSIRDITDRKRREQQIRRERDTKEAIREILVQSSNRHEIERSFCEQAVATDDVAFAWVGRHTPTGELVPEGRAGEDEGYLQDVDFDTDREDGEPCAAAVRTRELQTVGDVRTSREPWAAEAEASGVRSILAAPLVYRDVLYGVFAVYATEPGVFDDERRTMFSDLADSLAYAINVAESREALLSDTVVAFEFQTSDPNYYLSALASDQALGDDETAASVEGVLPHSGDSVLTFLTVRGLDPDSVRESIVDREGVREVRVTSRSTDESRLQVVVQRPTLESILVDCRGDIRSMDVESGSVRATVDFPQGTDVREVLERVQERYPDTTVVSGKETERTPRTQSTLRNRVFERLTEKQAEAVRAAYYAGFLEFPRQSTAEEVAETLGVSQSTFLEHFRVAERKVFTTLLDPE